MVRRDVRARGGFRCARRVVLFGLVVGGLAAHADGEPGPHRKTKAADLFIDVKRSVLPNGVTVLLAPDPRAQVVAVEMSFPAGAIYEPPGKSGLAHLVEHLMSAGATPETDYWKLLDRRGAIGFNASTDFDRMSFHVEVPPEELPLALWAAADRIGTLPGLLTEAEVKRSVRIIGMERMERVEDQPYGAASVALMHQLFPSPHPLHEQVIGRADGLASVTLADVLAFVDRCLVADGAILAVTGRFDPAVAQEWVGRTVARLPPSPKVSPTFPTPEVAASRGVSVAESLGRRPQVTLGWTFKQPSQLLTDALRMGAFLISGGTDLYSLMSIDAGLLEYTGGALFELELTLPYTVGSEEASDDANRLVASLVDLRFSTRLIEAAYLVWDRAIMTRLQRPGELAEQLPRMELAAEDHEFARYLNRHWLLTPEVVRDMLGAALQGPRITVHAKPKHPLVPPKRR